MNILHDKILTFTVRYITVLKLVDFKVVHVLRCWRHHVLPTEWVQELDAGRS